MDDLDTFLRTNGASIIIPLLPRLKILRNGTVYLPDDVAIEHLAEHLLIPLDFILQSSKFYYMLQYGVNPRGFVEDIDEEERETIDGLSVLHMLLIGNVIYKIIDGVLGRPGDLDKLAISYAPPKRNLDVEAWLLLPSETFIDLILSNGIRGQQLLAMCNANKRISARCSARNEELFKIILRKEHGLNNIRNAREIYTKLVRRRVWVFGKLGDINFGSLHALDDVFGVSQISSGSVHMAVLDIYGQIWTIGRSRDPVLNYGQLGHGNNDYLNVLTMIPGHKRVKKISCGMYHTAFLSAQGQIWTFGSGTNGELGHDNTNNLNIPTIIEGFQGLIDVSCGSHHTAFLDAEGQVYTFGDNTNGKLGQGLPGHNVFVPTMIPGFRNIKQVSCAAYHTGFLDIDGCVWTFGLGNRLGHTFGVSLVVPTKLPRFQGVKQLSCSNVHSIILDADGQAWIFGVKGTTWYTPVPIRNFRNLKEVSCSLNSMAFLDSSGKVWVEGDFYASTKVLSVQPNGQERVRGSTKPVMLIQEDVRESPIENVEHVWCGEELIAYIM
jgi:alpha-tubulin suppressor-like RCC1 family protein